MNYTFNQLQILVSVAEHGGITRAAEQLHLTQPAVSIQLKKLQEQFEIPLTEVIGRRLYMTEFGNHFVEFAKRILTEASELENLAKAYKGHLVGTLNFSIVSTAKYILPYFLNEFVSQHPQVKLIMDVTNKGSVIKHLEKNDVDFALVSVLPENLKLEREVFMDNELHLVGANKEENINLEEVPLIFREPGSATRAAMEKFLKDKKIQVSRSITLTSNEAVKQAIMAGLGYSIMPLIGIKKQLQNQDLYLIPHKDLPIKTQWNLVWLKEKRLSPIAEAYLSYVRSSKESLIDRFFQSTDSKK